MYWRKAPLLPGEQAGFGRSGNRGNSITTTVPPALRDPNVNADGSVDIYFGPTAAAKGKEENWIRTNPEKGFFIVFRFYGTVEGNIEKTWVHGDFEQM